MGVTGIGGIFFRARDPEALRAWYLQHFGLCPIGWEPWEQQAGPTVFMPFKADTDYFAADKQWMLNLRVDDIDDMLASLRSAGMEVKTDPAWDTPETGRFARVHDPEGNAVELWQPPPD
jgi:catechol 2,3-dioxygenase-like lactoylglutathione lyase family enzyme